MVACYRAAMGITRHRGRAIRSLLASSWFALVASTALLVGVDAQPVSATPLWLVNFIGHGSSKSNAKADLSSTGCPDATDTTSVSSSFFWIVTWHHVALSIPPVTGNITGVLYGHTHETDDKKAPPACGGSHNCDKDFDFTGDQGLDGSNPAALLFHKSLATGGEGNDILILDLLVFSDQDAECQSLDPDDTGFLVANPASFNPNATDALAASATIPASELRHSGKIIIVVHKTAFNFPTAADEDCSDADLGLTECTQSQSWDGNITLTRSG